MGGFMPVDRPGGSSWFGGHGSMGCSGSGSGWRLGLIGAGALALGAGCGSDYFAPPKALKAVSTSESAAPAKTVYMVLTGPPDAEMEILGKAAQREALDHRAIFRLAGPGPGEPTSKQAAAIRKAIEDGTDALIVVPNDEPSTPIALEEARDKGIPVVLLGRAIPPVPGKPPYILVKPEPFAETARRLVETAQADAVKNQRPGDGEAILFSPKAGDVFAAERLAALKAAAEAARFRKVEVVRFEGTPEAALKAALEDAKKRPDLVVLLGDGDEGTELAIRLRYALKGSPLAFVGGYAGTRGQFSPNPYFDESAFAEFRPDNLARLALLTALARASGESGDPVVTLPTKFNRGRGTTSFGIPTLSTDPPPAGPPPPRRPRSRSGRPGRSSRAPRPPRRGLLRSRSRPRRPDGPGRSRGTSPPGRACRRLAKGISS